MAVCAVLMVSRVNVLPDAGMIGDGGGLMEVADGVRDSEGKASREDVGEMFGGDSVEAEVGEAGEFSRSSMRRSTVRLAERTETDGSRGRRKTPTERMSWGPTASVGTET